MLRERKESRLSVKAWCAEHGITEHAYYYRLRQMACNALEQTQPTQLAEVPLVPKSSASQTNLLLTTKAGSLEIMNMDQSGLDQVLWVMLDAE